jgi:hypothetical protein
MTGSSGWWSAVSVLSAGWLLAASGVAKLAPSMMFGYVLKDFRLELPRCSGSWFLPPKFSSLLYS